MAISPVPPILPGKQIKFGGDARFVYGLLVAISLAAVVVVPISVEVLGWVFRRELHVDTMVIARAIVVSILAPLVAGLVVRHLAPGPAEHIAPWVTRIGTALLAIGAVLILVNAWPAMVSLFGSGALIAFIAIAVIAMAVGHWSGGADPRNRTVLAIAAPMRHPGVAIAVAHATFPNENLAPAAILLLLLVGVFATSVYGKVWGRRSFEADAAGADRVRPS
jgi:BASS family bile acid:Na+ symporter